MSADVLAVHPLTYLMQLRGWGKIQFARMMCDHGASLKIHLATNRTLVWKWEQGQEPEPDAQYVLADMLGVNPRTLVANPWPSWLPVWEVTGIMAPWTKAGTVDVLVELVRSGHMDRRGFLTITGAAMATVAASWASASPAFASALNGDQVTDSMADTLEARVATLQTLDAQMGGARLIEQARGDLAIIISLLKQGRHTEAVEARLYGLAARVNYIAGWMAYDSGLRSAGQQYYLGALRAAKTVGDDALGSFLLAEMGVHLSDDGNPAERVAQVETALANTSSTMQPGVRSYLELHHAESLSRDGQHQQAGSALNRAHDLWARNGSDQLPTWLSWYGDAQLSSTEGKIMLRSGQFDRATSALASSIDHAVPRDQAVRAGRLATARLAGKDLDGALDAANRGLSLLETQVHSVRAVDRLTKFEGYLKPHQAEPAVAEFRDRLRALPAMAA
ncbi:transcriptional regulator [Kitasatospora sp. NBC_01250]|uniref:transcriptional regulator n=1 Tax=Kitasatospora sp. NBC_01250 TaxID=2903571 RepID=UPI002E2ED60F|nr:transcriptional regulator [Kitasatospora sp. NBC_01250]